MWKVICTFRTQPQKNWESPCLALSAKDNEERRCKREVREYGGGSCRLRVCILNNQEIQTYKNKEVSVEKLGELFGLSEKDNSYYNRKYRIDKINNSDLNLKIESIKESGKITTYKIS